MSAWFEISLQGDFWVPFAGWAKWEATRDLDHLVLNTERLEITSMDHEHRVRAAALLLSHAADVVVLNNDLVRVFDAIASDHFGCSLLPLNPDVDVLEDLYSLHARLDIAPRVLSRTPLCLALLDQPPIITPHITPELVRSLTSALPPSSRLDALVESLLTPNDAIALHALRSLAHLNKHHRVSLLDTLVCDGVLLHDALILQERVLPPSR